MQKGCGSKSLFINLLRGRQTGSEGSRNPHIFLYMLRFLRAVLPRLAPARYGSSTGAKQRPFSLSSGAAFEARALQYLQQRGMTLVARNVRYRFGEIDLVMRAAGGVFVFVEVRARANPRFGGALASISAAKRVRLRRAARAYLITIRKGSPACRFDIVAFDGKRIAWLVDAFSADEC
jgi:putative endonuclease